MNSPCPQDRRIKSAQAPSRRRRIPGFHVLIIDCLLNSRTVRIQGIARCADFGDFEENLADPVALTDPHRAPVQSARGEIFSECAMIQWKPLFLELIDALGGDDQDRLARSAVDLRMRLFVAGNAQRGDHAGRDGTLGYAAWRNVNLEDRSRMHLVNMIAQKKGPDMSGP